MILWLFVLLLIFCALTREPETKLLCWWSLFSYVVSGVVSLGISFLANDLFRNEGVLDFLGGPVDSSLIFWFFFIVIESSGVVLWITADRHG